MKHKLILVAVLGILVYFAFFWRLDGALLWRDEATTANWGREMAMSNRLIPTVWNGEQLLVQGSRGHDFNDKFQPAMQGWLQFYVSALSFKLFGINTFTARFLFTLIGVAGIALFFLIFRDLFGSQKLALLAAGLAMLSLPYLHYARQSRYYVLVMVLALALIYEFVKIFKDEAAAQSNWPFVRIGVYGVLLFFSNYFSFGIFWVCLLLSIFVIRKKAFTLRLLLTTAAVALLVTPALLTIHGSFIQRAGMTDFAYLSDYWDWFLQAFSRLNALFPVLIFLLLGAILAARFREQTQSERKFAIWLWLSLLATLLVSVFLNKSNAFLRYYLHVIPIAILLTAIYAVWLSRIWNPRVAVAMIVLVLIYHNWSPVLDHSQSILKRQLAGNDSFNGPMVEFLRENVRPEEKVAFIQNDIGMVAHFYLPELKWCALLEARNPYNLPYKDRLPAEMFDDFSDIDWVVVWATRGLPSRVDVGYELVWNYRFGLNLPAKGVEKNIYVPKQYTITQAEAGMPVDLSYFDFYRQKRTPAVTNGTN